MVPAYIRRLAGELIDHPDARIRDLARYVAGRRRGGDARAEVRARRNAALAALASAESGSLDLDRLVAQLRRHPSGRRAPLTERDRLLSEAASLPVPTAKHIRRILRSQKTALLAPRSEYRARDDAEITNLNLWRDD
jgi:hypothetical protein